MTVTTAPMRVFGTHDEKTKEQLARCLMPESAVGGALLADGHYGYSQPVGGVVAYRDMLSPSGVGFDIGCGNLAVRTNLVRADIAGEEALLADQISRAISFGIGRKNKTPVDHALFESDAWRCLPGYGRLRDLARSQLGTVGSGNHYVDILIEEATDAVWVACHFGSRGLGHKTATGFLNLANGREFDARSPGESMEQPPTLINAESDLGVAYLAAMTLCGAYARAGRETVVATVLDLLGAETTMTVHNHHNYLWEETHNGESLFVVRKGATPCWPGQVSFIGGSMADISVIIRGKESDDTRASFYSTVHGAGRVMSRTAAAGKMNYKTKTRSGGAISQEMMENAINRYGVTVRGGGPDESPFVYRPLDSVLAAHADTFTILHTLRPVVVVMAGANEVDPYKD